MELDQRRGEEEADVWQLYYTAEGHAYYHNHLTGESSWAEASELEGSAPSEFASGGSSSWNSEDEDRFQTYLLTPDGQRALQTEELQAEQILAQRRKRLEQLGSGFSLTPRSPKELAEAYSDMEELSDAEDRAALLFDRQTTAQQQQASTPYAAKANQRSASSSSLYQNGSVPIVDSPVHTTPRPFPPQYSDPRQQFDPLLDALYLSQPFEQPEYYDTRSPKSRGHKPSGKHRHRDRRRSQRHPPSFKYSNHFHDGVAGSDLDTDDESASGSDAEEDEEEDEDLKEILAIDESFAKVYNMFAVTGAALSACTAHASKWMYEHAAAIMSAVYSRAVQELEKLAASEHQQQRQSRSQRRSRPQVALA